jgi:SAM-dependent methyltransferase
LTLTENGFGRVGGTDAEFDVLLPPPARQASAIYWTPVVVAQRAAELLTEVGVRRVLDVGAGPGKFCIVGASRAPSIAFVGIEHRPHLVAIAEHLAREMGTPNARFRLGNVTSTSWSEFDALYVFNSFAENLFSAVERFDDTVELSRARYVEDVLAVGRKLAELPEGTFVLTYHGLGGPIPDVYERVRVEPAGTGWLNLWRHRGASTSEMSWLEDDAGICAVSTAELRQVLRSVEHDGSPLPLMLQRL